MVSTRCVAFLRLARTRLQAHERVSVWSQSGGSHNSDSEHWLTRSCGMHTSSIHLSRWRAAMRYHTRYRNTISSTTLVPESTAAGYFVPGCPVSFPIGALGRVWCLRLVWLYLIHYFLFQIFYTTSYTMSYDIAYDVVCDIAFCILSYHSIVCVHTIS